MIRRISLRTPIAWVITLIGVTCASIWWRIIRWWWRRRILISTIVPTTFTHLSMSTRISEALRVPLDICVRVHPLHIALHAIGREELANSRVIVPRHVVVQPGDTVGAL